MMILLKAIGLLLSYAFVGISVASADAALQGKEGHHGKVVVAVTWPLWMIAGLLVGLGHVAIWLGEKVAHALMDMEDEQ